MNSLIIVGLFAALTASANAGILSGGFHGSPIGGLYSTSVVSSGPVLHTAPVATSSITQQRIVNSVPIATRIIASPGLTSSSYISGGQANLGGIGYSSSNGGTLNGYGGYERNGY